MATSSEMVRVSTKVINQPAISAHRPAAAARLLTQRFESYVALSTALGAAAGIVGYGLATVAAPRWIGSAVDASGTVALTAGLFLAAAAAATVRSRPKS